VASKKYLMGLRVLRTERKMSQGALAHLLGVNESTISRYESQLRFPREKFVKAACELFGCELWELCHPDPIGLRQVIALGQAAQKCRSIAR
jgi:transcriptional regulator with XRE-family HTH domain